MADTLPFVAWKGLGFSRFLVHRATAATLLFLTDSSSSSDPSTSSSSSSTSTVRSVQISAFLHPLGAVAPPPVKRNSIHTVRRTPIKRRRRTRQRSDNGSEEVEDYSYRFFDGGSGSGEGGSPPFGRGGSGGGSGGGWSSDGSGWWNWDESSSYWSDPAFDLVYEVLCWIVLSNCLHFAIKKVFLLVVEGFSDQGRGEKSPLILASVVC